MDHARFERIYRQHAEAVLRYATYRVGHDCAEDIVAETFAVAWQKMDRLPEEAKPWLLATARRLTANHLRARHKRVATELTVLDEVLAEGSGDTAGTANVERQRDLVAALRVLPPLDREAVLLVTWYDLSNAEAAEVMECSTTAFGVRLHRARRRLGRILRDGDTHPSLPTRLEAY